MAVAVEVGREAVFNLGVVKPAVRSISVDSLAGSPVYFIYIVKVNICGELIGSSCGRIFYGIGKLVCVIYKVGLVFASLT